MREDRLLPVRRKVVLDRLRSLLSASGVRSRVACARLLPGGPSQSVESRSDATGPDPCRRLVRALADAGGNAVPRPPRRGNRRGPRANRLHRRRDLRRDGADRGLWRSRVPARHPADAVLRDNGGRPAQEVVETVEIPVERLDLTDVDSSERSQRFDEALRVDRARGIDLGHAPAMRLLIVNWSSNEHRIVWTFHHALLDGRSFPLVLREVFGFADASCHGTGARPPGATAIPRVHRVPSRPRSRLCRGVLARPAWRASPRRRRSSSTGPRSTTDCRPPSRESPNGGSPWRRRRRSVSSPRHST